jgi:glycosyltransferase involved in cell wall biosynthesis
VREQLRQQPVKKVLMIAYYFPPVGGIGVAGSQRVLKFAKYLPCHQWQPLILTVKEPYYESYLLMDPTLLDKVPPGIRIIRTSVLRWLTRILEYKNTVKLKFLHNSKNELSKMSAQVDRAISQEKGWYQSLKDTFTDLFEIPDEESGWFLPAFFRGIRLIRDEKIDLIYSTGRPWTAHLIGTALKVFTRRPLVSDFRDPWLTNPFRLEYSPLKNRLEAFFEKTVIEKSDLVIANTDNLKYEFIRRFSRQPSSKFISILNGFDPDDYSFDIRTQKSHDGIFTITHTGFLYGKRDPKIFLDAVKLLLDEKKIDHHLLKILLVGSVALPYDINEYIYSNGLDKIIELYDHVVHKKSLQYLQQSDVLLLLQPGTKTQIPSKLFEYIGMGKPILAISPRDGATCDLVTKENLGEVAEPDDVRQIANAIYKLYLQWANGLRMDHLDREIYRKFNVKSLTTALAAELSKLASKSRAI